MTVTLLKRLATLAALVCLAATLNTSAVGAQESRPGTDAALAEDQTPAQQINRLYGAIFDRTPDDGGFAFWVNELTSGARNLTQIADAMVGISPEFTDTYGNLDNRNFVNQLYLNVQDRPGETSGVDFWTGQLDTNTRTRGGVVLGFSESPEYRSATGSTDPLDRLYCAFFLRNPDAGGAVFYADQYLTVERSLNNIAQEFTQSPEFTDLYGSLTDRQFVELIYQNVLGRNLPLTEVGGPNFWTSELTSGARTRGQVMVEFSEAQEYRDRWTRNAPCPPAGTSVLTAVDDRVIVFLDTATPLNVLTNDAATAGATISFPATSAKNGSLTATAGGDILYTPATGYVLGRDAEAVLEYDTFTYTLNNGATTSTATVEVVVLAEPNCEVFMNFPNGSTTGVGGNPAQMELFFSSEACVEVYDQNATFVVDWDSLTIDGVAATAAVGNGPLQGLVPVPAGDLVDDSVTVAGTAVLSVNGTDSVSINFGLEFTTADGGTTWTRTVASYSGRGDDVQILVNPLP